MGELERRRDAQDLWISHGHLRAGLVGAFMLSAVSFGTGYLLGNGGPTEPASRQQAFGAQVPGEDLVALLARVESNRAPLGGVEALTFPDALAGATANVGPIIVEGETSNDSVVFVGSDTPVDLPGPPAGQFTLQLASLANEDSAAEFVARLTPVDGVTPWVGAQIVDGEVRYTVSMGSFASEAAVLEALAEVALGPDYANAEVVKMAVEN